MRGPLPEFPSLPGARRPRPGPLVRALLAGAVLAALALAPLTAQGGGIPVTVRVKANPALKGYIERTVRQKLVEGQDIALCDQMFSFFVSIVALPVVAGADNATIGYTLSVLVLEPLSAELLAEHVQAETLRHLEPYFSQTGIVRDFKLFVTQEKRLDEVLDEIAESVRATVASGVTRERPEPGQPASAASRGLDPQRHAPTLLPPQKRGPAPGRDGPL